MTGRPRVSFSQRATRYTIVFGTSAITAEPAGHVAVQRAVADRQLRLVAGRQQQRAALVRQRHQQVAADARLDVLLGDVARRAGERRAQRVVHRAHRRFESAASASRCRGCAASASESSTLPRLENGDGISTPSTWSAPSASTAIAAVSAESMPPDRPSTARRSRTCARSRACRARARARSPIRRAQSSDAGADRHRRRRRDRRCTTSASNARPRAIGAPSASNAQLRPSNTRSSLPPNWLT